MKCLSACYSQSLGVILPAYSYNLGCDRCTHLALDTSQGDVHGYFHNLNDSMIQSGSLKYPEASQTSPDTYLKETDES